VDFLNGTPQQDLAALEAVETHVDWIGVIVSDADMTANLRTLQALIAQHEAPTPATLVRNGPCGKI
jgi:hypothetical protein